MSESILRDLVSVLTAIVGVAIIAVILSKQSNTQNVLSSFGTAISTDIKTAVSPLTSSSVIG
jgi:PRD1 phage membrane DNA delivery